MLTHQGCPQTPGGRMGARGRRRGPIPAVCHRYSSPVLNLAVSSTVSACGEASSGDQLAPVVKPASVKQKSSLKAAYA